MLSTFNLYRELISHIWRIGLFFIGEKIPDNLFLFSSQILEVYFGASVFRSCVNLDRLLLRVPTFSQSLNDVPPYS